MGEEFTREPAREARVVAESDVVVVGGGPTGIAAAVASARQGARVTLLERYPHLGGLASGGLVLVLDDMANGSEISVRGICEEFINRLDRLGLAVYPPPTERGSDETLWRKWSRWGLFDFHSHLKPQPINYSVAFDPEGWKRVSDDLVAESKIHLRLHSWFSLPIVEDGSIKGVICETKSGREAIRGKVVIDATGDLDVASRAGAPFISSTYMVTTVFRLGGVDTDAAERFEHEEPEAFAERDRRAKTILGGSWDKWWLKTPLPGVVWCNCPHLTGLDATRVEDLTRAEFLGRPRIHALIDFARENLPGFERGYLIDVAAQTGVRQTRLLEGEYVVTREDIARRVHFPDSVARGRDYYTPYRALLPRGVEQLLVAGRHYSATPAAQKISREIPPCMAMGEAAGIAAVLALESNVRVRHVDVARLQGRLRQQGADPGDVPAPNALSLSMKP